MMLVSRSKGRILILVSVLVFLVPAGAVAFAQIQGGDDVESLPGAPDPIGTAFGGVPSGDPFLGPENKDGVSGGREVDSEGSLHRLPTASPEQMPDTTTALEASEALNRLREEDGFDRILSAIDTGNAADLLSLAQGEDDWPCRNAMWGWDSAAECLADPGTTTEGRYLVIYWGCCRLAAGVADDVLAAIFANEPTPILGLRSVDGESVRLYFTLNEPIDLSDYGNFGRGPFTRFYVHIEPGQSRPIRSLGVSNDVVGLPRVIEMASKDGQQQLLFPATLDEIPGWTAYAPEYDR